MAIDILPVYPQIEIEGKWMLKDDSGENFMCFTVPMKIEGQLMCYVGVRHLFEIKLETLDEANQNKSHRLFYSK